MNESIHAWLFSYGAPFHFLQAGNRWGTGSDVDER